MLPHRDPARQPGSQNAGDSPSLMLSEKASHILSQHSHLDLTDVIEFVDRDIRGCGGFADVYYGRLITCDKYVAIKRLRVHIQREIKLSKVCDALTRSRFVLMSHRISPESCGYGHLSHTPTSSPCLAISFLKALPLHSSASGWITELFVTFSGYTQTRIVSKWFAWHQSGSRVND
jgi:hypothetical protein